MRNLIIALLATAALPGVASAQREVSEADDAPNYSARSRGDPGQARPQRAERQAPEQVALRQERREARPARDDRRNDAGNAARTQANGEVRAGRWSGNGGIVGAAQVDASVARGRGRDGFDRPTAVAAPAAQQRDWNGNRRDGVERPASATAPAAQQRDWNANRREDGQRDYNRRDDDRRDYNRRDDDRRGYNGRNDNRGDWNRNDGNRNDGRWNGNRDNRNWDRGWRNNSRYDWQRFRGSNRYAFRLPRYAAPYGWSYGYRRFSIGAQLFSGLFARNYWISDPWAYRLPPTQWPYQWVRYYNDALLIDTRYGTVVDSIPDIFWY